LPPSIITNKEKYTREKAKLSRKRAKALRKALKLNEAGAIHLSESHYPEGVSKKFVLMVALTQYKMSLESFPTADGHVGIASYYVMERDLDRAEAECERALKMDPTFGGAYNGLARIRALQGCEQEVIELCEKAKLAPRNDDRYLVCAALARLHKRKNRMKPSVHEYIQMLYWLKLRGAGSIIRYAKRVTKSARALVATTAV
jgi:tetratricopeptide (TPR) repeat protein